MFLQFLCLIWTEEHGSERVNPHGNCIVHYKDTSSQDITWACSLMWNYLLFENIIMRQLLVFLLVKFHYIALSCKTFTWGIYCWQKNLFWDEVWFSFGHTEPSKLAIRHPTPSKKNELGWGPWLEGTSKPVITRLQQCNIFRTDTINKTTELHFTKFTDLSSWTEKQG